MEGVRGKTRHSNVANGTECDAIDTAVTVPNHDDALQRIVKSNPATRRRTH